MYYKILKDGKVVDFSIGLNYARYNPRLNRMVLSDLDHAQGIISSDERHIWHLRGLYAIPVEGYETVEAVEIEEDEYLQLKALNGRTPEEIIDAYTLFLIEEGLL